MLLKLCWSLLPPAQRQVSEGDRKQLEDRGAGAPKSRPGCKAQPGAASHGLCGPGKACDGGSAHVGGLSPTGGCQARTRPRRAGREAKSCHREEKQGVSQVQCWKSLKTRREGGITIHKRRCYEECSAIRNRVSGEKNWAGLSDSWVPKRTYPQGYSGAEWPCMPLGHNHGASEITAPSHLVLEQRKLSPRDREGLGHGHSAEELGGEPPLSSVFQLQNPGHVR